MLWIYLLGVHYSAHYNYYVTLSPIQFLLFSDTDILAGVVHFITSIPLVFASRIPVLFGIPKLVSVFSASFAASHGQ